MYKSHPSTTAQHDTKKHFNLIANMTRLARHLLGSVPETIETQTPVRTREEVENNRRKEAHRRAIAAGEIPSNQIFDGHVNDEDRASWAREEDRQKRWDEEGKRLRKAAKRSRDRSMIRSL